MSELSSLLFVIIDLWLKFFDTHTHLNVDNFAGKEQEEVDFAAELGVVKMNIVGFDKATIKFEFNEELLEDADFDPVIYYFNEEKQLLEELDTTVVGNVASTEVTHFSKYILLNRKVYQNSFEWQDVWNTTGFSGVEAILVIDDSGSMVSNDRYNQRLTDCFRI